MSNSLNFLHYQTTRIDWQQHDATSAQQRLAASANAANHRRLREGAGH